MITKTWFLRSPEGATASSPEPGGPRDTAGGDAPPTVTAAEADTFRLGIPLEARPDGVPDNLWDAETSTLQLGRALKQIRDKDVQLHQSHEKLRAATASKAPEGGYAIALPEGADHDLADSLKDDPFLTAVQTQLGEWGVSQEQHDALIARIVPMLTPSIDAMSEALDGTYNGRGRAVIDANLTWLKSFEDQPEVYASLRRIASVAPGHIVLKAIRDKTRPPQLGGNGDVTTAPPPLTEADLKEKIRERNALNPWDPGYDKLNREINDGYKALYPEDSA